jgi:hypothetical protein
MSSRPLPDTELVEPFRAPPIDAESLSAEELVRWAAEEHGDKLCLTCSWQKQSSVLVHMVSDLGIDLAVTRSSSSASPTRRATRSCSATASSSCNRT